MASRPLRVGLTGGLACGKSTVLRHLAALGAGTIDADRLAREALAAGSPLLVPLRAEFGDAAFTPGGEVDRSALARVVFADPERRRALEAIVHPEVIRREEEATARLFALGHRIVVVDAALLVEIGRHRHFDRLVVVACPPQAQLARAVARGMSEEDAQARIASQLPLEAKLRLADHVIDTGGSLAQTREQSEAVFRALERDAAALESGP